MTRPLTIVIAAGGESRRMGRDKALLRLEGVPLLERIIRAALATDRPVMVVGRPPCGNPLPDVRFLEDEESGKGPLGGLVTAFHHTDGDVLLAACDMPLLTTDAFLQLIEVDGREGGSSGTVTCRDGRDQPLFSVYRRSILPTAERLLREERRAMAALLEAGDFTRYNAPGELVPLLRGVNTPEEFEEVRRGRRN